MALGGGAQPALGTLCELVKENARSLCVRAGELLRTIWGAVPGPGAETHELHKKSIFPYQKTSFSTCSDLGSSSCPLGFSFVKVPLSEKGDPNLWNTVEEIPNP